jgi:hypothetical protein
VTANDFGLEEGTDDVCTFKSVTCCTSSGKEEFDPSGRCTGRPGVFKRLGYVNRLDIGFVKRRGFSNVLALLEDLLLVCSFCFLDASFLKVAMSDNASFQFLEFAGGSLIDFENKLNRENEFAPVWSFAKDKGAMVDEVLDFHVDGV